MTTHETKVKCTNCGLHYLVLSWDEGWHTRNEGGFCPECGIKGSKIVWVDETAQQIFEVVPGPSEMVQMFGKAETAPFAPGAKLRRESDSPLDHPGHPEEDLNPEASMLRRLGELRREGEGA